MKLQTLVLFLSISISLFSQKDWGLLNPTPSTSPGIDIHFVTNEVGYILTSRELLKTTDAGENWTISQKLLWANDMQFYNSTGVIVSDTRYILNTIDSGNTWDTIATPKFGGYNSVNMINEDTILISNSNQLLSTYDGGKNWESYDIPYYSNKTFFINSKVGHAACNSGLILKTIDGGLNWYITESASTTPSDYFTIYFVNSKVGFASREHTQLFKTTDGGESWVEITNTSKVIYSFTFFDEKNGFIAGEGGSIFKTVNGGSSWEWSGNQIDKYYNGSICAMHFIDNKIGFATGWRGIILKTIDGGNSWKSYSPTYDNVKQVDFVTNDIAYALVSNEFFKSTDGGYKWTNLGSPAEDKKTKCFDFVNDSVGYAIGGSPDNSSGNDGYVYKTTDGGITWNTEFFSSHVTAEDLYCIDFVNKDTGFVSGGYSTGCIFKTTNGGVDWEKVEYITCDQIQFVNSTVGYSKRQGRMYMTTDGGTTWNLNFEAEDDINCLHFLDEDHGYFVGDGSLMYKTADGGETWEKLEVPYAHYEFVQFYSYNIGYILDDDGVLYKTENGGNNWERIMSYAGINYIELFGDNIYLSGTLGKILKSEVEFNESSLEINPILKFSCDEAQLTGTVASNGNEIDSIRFEYSTDTLFSSSIDATPNIVSGGTVQSISAPLSLLEPETTYYARIKGNCNSIEKYSSIVSFTTQPEYEIYLYNPEIYNTDISLLARISVYKDTLKNIVFEYGKIRDYSNYIETSPNQINKNSFDYVEAELTSLDTNSTYYYRLKADLGSETIYSSENILQFKEGVVIIPFEVQQLADSAVLLQGLIKKTNWGKIYNIQFEYGTTKNLGDFIHADLNMIYDTETHTVTSILDSLSPHVKYYFRISATYGENQYYSNIFSYTLGETNGLVQTNDFSNIFSYPNPTNDCFVVNSSEPIEKIELLDSHGKLLLIKTTEEPIDISDYPKGFYLIKIYTRNEQITRKIIKK